MSSHSSLHLYLQDKNEMILHHCVTILLIYFSWACNFVRVGTLVLVVHDVADPWLAVSWRPIYIVLFLAAMFVCKGIQNKMNLIILLIALWITMETDNCILIVVLFELVLFIIVCKFPYFS